MDLKEVLKPLPQEITHVVCGGIFKLNKKESMYYCLKCGSTLGVNPVFKR